MKDPDEDRKLEVSCFYEQEGVNLQKLICETFESFCENEMMADKIYQKGACEGVKMDVGNFRP